MSSEPAANRLRLAKEIQNYGHETDAPCDRCFARILKGKEVKCIVMEHNNRLRCSECVRLGRPCVNLSWASLDKTRDEYRKKVDEDEAELSRVLARLMRNKKILRQAEQRARKKMECLASEMDANNELEVEEDCPAADALVGLSPAVWSTLDLANQAIDFSSTVQGQAV
ncbi:hypothetical protein B9Z65_7305 [Elsinoe australis]|uniref:Uncharacterized protein n=1 Tax=Elsinoe australis TaxID=40998 RepID=A0A2P7Z6U6_9PEZI|nr:hypothetical protein B9Z65_7305 [Elsinoe australis]